MTPRLVVFDGKYRQMPRRAAQAYSCRESREAAQWLQQTENFHLLERVVWQHGSEGNEVLHPALQTAGPVTSR